MKTVAVSAHEKNLRAMRCVVSHNPFGVTLHHCHGGSMRYIEGGSPGMGQRSNPFYQIPIHANYHVGEFGIDTGMGPIKSVEQWEDTFGTQLEFLTEVNGLLSYDLWEQADQWHQSNRA